MVTPDNMSGETLEQLIATDEDGIREFEKTAHLVRAILFSVISDRRRYALKVLKENWGAHQVDVASKEEDGIINSYISFTGKDGPYIYVGSYNADVPVGEQPPSAEEMKDWDNF